MKDMLSYLVVARDTMHQNLWLAAWEEMDGREGIDDVPQPSGR